MRLPVACCGLLAASLFPQSAVADISVMGAYVFGGQVEEVDVDNPQKYDVNSAPAFQASLDFATSQPVSTYDKNHQNYVGAFVSWQPTDITTTSGKQNIDVGYAHVTASRRWNYGSFETYATGGAGLSHFSTSDSNIGRFSISLGGGYLYHLTESLDLKLEGRLYSTFFSDSYTFSCGGGCFAKFSGSLWTQASVAAGLNYRF